MSFNNLLFIFLFLPISLLLMQFLPSVKGKKLVLVCLSFLFYGWANPVTMILLAISIGWNYFSGIELSLYEGKLRKIIFIISIGFNVLILAFYKYMSFFFGVSISLSLPVGLSFFTFSAISYLADVYNQKSESQSSLLSLALYISFFGKVCMGPIVQYHDMEEELDSFPSFNFDIFGHSFKRFIKGLVKKVILADSFSVLVSQLNGNGTILGTWLISIGYMLEIYFDFSGYSDMALGISEMFGFHFDENFDHPYIATSVQNFWRRWHISLSRWFRDYIYIPLGGSRVSDIKYIRNIFIVWVLTGLWHGANWTFIVWGLYYGILLLLERFFLKKHLEKWPAILQHIYTLLLVLIGWVFFMSPTLMDAFTSLGKMIGIGATSLWDMKSLFYFKQYGILFILGICFSIPVQEKIETFILKKGKRIGMYLNVLIYLLMFLIGISFVVSSTFTSFLYFAF